ncbi:amidoligase family protein [Rhodoflexus caldus]|uniref:amidoligase family protein n=1 Tax=Rhodoflexus caldus TaxID=2891236 RepID=UPI002029DFF0|nr:amidoligase family protein [Rhodoflexus caldus]
MPERIQNNAEIRSIVNGSGTKSDKARRLAAIGVPAAEIARLLNMSAGHVRQSIVGRNRTSNRSTSSTESSTSTRHTTSIDTNNAEIRSIVNGSGTKSDKARRLAAIGVPAAEIARLLNMSAGHVRQSIVGRNRTSSSGRSTSRRVEQVSALTNESATGRVSRVLRRNRTSQSELPPSVRAASQTAGVQVTREGASTHEAYTIELERHPNFRRKFGVEIECFLPIEGGDSAVSKARLIDKIRQVTGQNFKAHHDSSILIPSGSYYAVEVVSPVLTGIEGLKSLKKACDVLNEKGAEVNRSCGFHVHFDSQNFQVKDWKNIVGNYAILENDIDSFLAPSRRGDSNYYTKSLRKEGDNGFKTLMKALESSDLTELRRKTRIDNRYHKVNLYTYLKNHNTIEFRQHHGTIDFHKMAAWILFLDDLVKFSEYTVATIGGDEVLERFVNPDVMSHIIFRRQHLSNNYPN